MCACYYPDMPYYAECAQPTMTPSQDWREEVRTGVPWTQDDKAMLERIESLITATEQRAAEEIYARHINWEAAAEQRGRDEAVEYIKAHATFSPDRVMAYVNSHYLDPNLPPTPTLEAAPSNRKATAAG